MGFIKDIAPAVIGGAISALGIGEARQDRRQIKQQAKLNAMDMENAKTLNAMQMQNWHDTNYSAQVDEAKKAGLSMSIFGKGGGSSGATMGGEAMTNSGTAADPAQAQAVNTQQGMQIAQLALMNAQKENIKADTANKLADAEQKGSQTGINKTELEIKNATKQDVINTVGINYQRAVNENEKAFNEGVISAKTQEAKIQQAQAEAIGQLVKNQIGKTEIGKNQAQTDQIVNEIKQKWEGVAQGWKQLDQQQQRIKIEQFANEIKANYPSIWNVGGKATNDFIDALNGMFGQTDYKKHTIK